MANQGDLQGSASASAGAFAVQECEYSRSACRFFRVAVHRASL